MENAAPNAGTGQAPGQSLALRDEADAMVVKLDQLPPEIGVMLVMMGVVGILLPGPVGSPFLIAGGVSLWPRAFGKLDRWYGRRFPKSHQSAMRMIARFVTDLEKRYPQSSR